MAIDDLDYQQEVNAPDPVAGSSTGKLDDADNNREMSEARRNLVQLLLKDIKADKAYHDKAFRQMRRDMNIARDGTDDGIWLQDQKYIANITGRHINQKVASLYAKNPKATARLRNRLEYQVWDETTESLQMAMQTMELAQAATATPQVTDDPTIMEVAPEMIAEAQMTLADFQQGTERKQILKKMGKTLEILFAYFTSEQQPIDFKMQMKQLVRRTCTTGVGYVKLGFQRQYQKRPEITSQISDITERLSHLEMLAKDISSGQVNENSPEIEELRLALETFRQQEEVLVREGLIYDFPNSTDVIPDRLCRNLVGFIGARRVTLEYKFTPQEVKELFGVTLNKGQYTPYLQDGTKTQESENWREGTDKTKQAAEYVCVWECYDKPSGNVYFLCDGYSDFLREPEAPEVFVESFWPLYALTFNEVEHESHLFPPSDVALLYHMQLEYNRARQGLREHRKSAIPRYVMKKAALDQADKDNFGTASPHEVIEINMAEGSIKDVLETVPVSGVDPNLYETGQLFTDVQLVVGSQEAQWGAVSKATATETAIAQGAYQGSVAANTDDLDNFLTILARSSGQILLREMSVEQVQKIAGPGSVWAEFTMEDIVDELYLEIQAGSSGKPNQAAEIQNWERMLPFLLQMPAISPEWLTKETLTRLDDRLDLTDAIAQNVPSIVAINRLSGLLPGNAPEDQGAAGADNGPPPPGGPSGSMAPGGNNQI